jgi:hypothetical protein
MGIELFRIEGYSPNISSVQFNEKFLVTDGEAELGGLNILRRIYPSLRIIALVVTSPRHLPDHCMP